MPRDPERLDPILLGEQRNSTVDPVGPDPEAARDAGNDIRAPELYRDRATLLVYCDCGRNVAFLTWPTRSRALLSYTKLRGPGGTLWADSGAWGANPKCPRCGRVFLLYLADLAPWIDAGPDAPRARLDFPTRMGTGVDSATS